MFQKPPSAGNNLDEENNESKYFMCEIHLNILTSLFFLAAKQSLEELCYVSHQYSNGDITDRQSILLKNTFKIF